jgi:CO/xanthine dehydrogenase FAD-binding subunit
VKVASFEYLRHSTLFEAVRPLARAPETAKLVAGSQSLGPMLNLRLVRPSVLIDVSRLEQLRQLIDSPGEHRIGAASRATSTPACQGKQHRLSRAQRRRSRVVDASWFGAWLK